MPKENNKIDINKHEIDIDTLKKQNVNDLLSIKQLYRKLEEIEEKLTQIKYIDNTLVKKLKKEYENLKKIILDENVQVKLTNDIETINVKLNNDIESINSQLDTIESIEINLLQKDFLFDGSDESEKLNSLLNENTDKSVTLIFPYGKSIILKNITFNSNKFLTIRGNNCVVTSGNNEYVFVNNNKTMLLNISDIVVNGDSGLVSFELSSDVLNSGTKLYAKNIEFKGSNRTATGINMKSTDFMNVENVIAYNLDTVIKLNSDIANGERANTQISIKNVNVHYSKYGLYLNGVDKINCIGFDCNRVSSGIIINKNVTRATFINYHCEYFGNYESTNSYDACGICINSRPNRNIKFQESTIFLPTDNGKYGVYMPSEFALDGYYNQVIFDNCYIPSYSDKANYKPLKLNGVFNYNSEFNYTNVIELYDSDNKLYRGRINPTNNVFKTRNLLNTTRITSLDDFSVKEGGTCTVTTSGLLTTFTNSSSTISKLLITKNLTVGWYTLIIQGDVNGNNLIIGLRNTPYTEYFNKKVYGTTDKYSIIYFYIDEDGLYKIEFDVNTSSYIELGDITLRKGLVTDY